MSLIKKFPKHLQQIIIPDQGYVGNNSMITGVVCCTCGCKEFALKMFGESYKDEYIRVKENGDSFSLCVAVKCSKCNKEWLLFDFAQHGYNALVGYGAASISDAITEVWYCTKCKKSNYKVNILLETENQEQFIHDILTNDHGSLIAEDYIEAFSWIRIDLECVECRRILRGWLNLETS